MWRAAIHDVDHDRRTGPGVAVVRVWSVGRVEHADLVAPQIATVLMVRHSLCEQ